MVNSILGLERVTGSDRFSTAKDFLKAQQKRFSTAKDFLKAQQKRF